MKEHSFAAEAHSNSQSKRERLKMFYSSSTSSISSLEDADSQDFSSPEENNPSATNRSEQINECSLLQTVGSAVIYKSSHVWTIRNLDLQALRKGACLESAVFSTGGHLRWCMIMNDPSFKSELLRVRVQLLNSGEVRAKFRMGILNGDRCTCREGSLATMYARGRGRAATSIIPVSYLRTYAAQLLPEGHLTLLCRINVELDAPRARLAEDLGRLLESERLSDVTLLVGGRELHAHKNILAARSLVFAAMFKHECMLEARGNVVEIADIEPEAMIELLRYVYTCQAERLEVLALDLFVAADKYALDDLKALCVDALCANLNVDNVVEILVNADLHCADELKKSAGEFLHEHAKQVVQTPAYKALGEDHLHLLLDHLPQIE